MNGQDGETLPSGLIRVTDGGDAKGGTHAEGDEFWDLSRLLPEKPRPVQAKPPAFVSVTPRTVTYASPGASGTGDCNFGKATGLGTPAQPTEAETETYVPAGHSLITSVTVTRETAGYSFYRAFREDALRLFDAPGEPGVPYTPSFPMYRSIPS